VTAWLEQRGVAAEELADTEDAWNRGDLDAMLAHTPPDAEWVISEENPSARTLRGPAEIRAYLEDWRDTVQELRFEVSERLDAGDIVVTIGTMSGRAGHDGPEITTALALVTRFRDGVPVRTEEYLDVERALEAARLS
jgi:ketosteroid isomerase-like protein